MVVVGRIAAGRKAWETVGFVVNALFIVAERQLCDRIDDCMIDAILAIVQKTGCSLCTEHQNRQIPCRGNDQEMPFESLNI